MENIMTYVKNKNINSDNTNDWIKLVINFIEDYNINATVEETDEGYMLIIKESEINIMLEMLYWVDELETSLDYIFEGRVFVE